MGLLDNLQGLLGTSPSDPQFMATNALAMGLLGGRGGGMQRLAGGLQGYGGVMAQAAQAEEEKRRRALQEQMLMQQLESAKAAQAERAAAQAQAARDEGIMRKGFAPMAGPNPDGSAGVAPRFDPAGMFGQGMSMGGLGQAAQLQSMLNPARKLTAYKPGDQVRDESGAVAFSVPDKPEADDKNVALLKLIHGEGTPAFFAALKKLGDKVTTHAPAATAISYGSPVPFQLPDGSTGYIQPGNREGAPPQVMVDPLSKKPAVKPVDSKDKDLTEAAAKATTYLGQMRSATKTLKDIGADQTALSLQAETALAGGPMNVVIREKAQRVRQSQDQWSEAFLRFKTGAASTPAEVAANRKSFFPVFGDKPENVRQKADMRLQAERDMEIAAGRGTKQLTEPPSQNQNPITGAKASGGGARRIASDEDYNALPSGALFTAPDGSTRRKP